MAMLLGKIRPPSLEYTNAYQVFQRLATDPTTRDKVAIITDDLTLTYTQLSLTVDSLCSWIKQGLGQMVTAEGTTSHTHKDTYGSEGTHEGKGGECRVDDESESMCDRKYGEEKHESTRTESQNVIVSGTSDPSSEVSSKVTAVALCLPRSPTLLALVLAIWKLGWAYVPLDPTVPALRSLYVLRDAEPVCVVTDTKTAIKIKTLDSDAALSPTSPVEKTTKEPPQPSDPIQSSPLADRILYIDEWNSSLEVDQDGESKSKCTDEGIDLGEEEKTTITINEGTGVSDKQEEINKCEIPGMTEEFDRHHYNEDTVACILYTSGSTGDPKGAQLTMGNIMNRFRWQWEELPFQKGEVCLMSKSLTFVDSLTEAMVPLLAGTPVVVVQEETVNPEILIRYVCRYNVTRLVLVPSLLKLLLLYLNTTKEAIRLLHQHVKIWITSGESLPAWLVNDFYAMFPGRQFLNLYGSTEVTGDVTWGKVEETNWKAGVRVPVGRPLDNTSVMVVRRTEGRLVLAETGQVGEVAVLGRNVCPGYLRGKVLSKEKHESASNKFVQISTITMSEDKQKQLEEFTRKVYLDHKKAKDTTPRRHQTARSPSSKRLSDDVSQNNLQPDHTNFTAAAATVTSTAATPAIISHQHTSPSKPSPLHSPHLIGRTRTRPVTPPRVRTSATPPPVPPRTPPRVPRRIHSPVTTQTTTVTTTTTTTITTTTSVTASSGSSCSSQALVKQEHGGSLLSQSQSQPHQISHQLHTQETNTGQQGKEQKVLRENQTQEMKEKIVQQSNNELIRAQEGELIINMNEGKEKIKQQLKTKGEVQNQQNTKEKQDTSRESQMEEQRQNQQTLIHDKTREGKTQQSENQTANGERTVKQTTTEEQPLKQMTAATNTTTTTAMRGNTNEPKTITSNKHEAADNPCVGEPQGVEEEEAEAAGRTLVYLTGDLGRVTKGQVVVEGRTDSQVKVRGVRVHLAELQDAVQRSGYVSDQCVLATGEGDGGGGGSDVDTDDEDDKILVAFVVLRQEFSDRDTSVSEDLTRCLRMYLPLAVVPRVVVLDSLPHLPSGKVDRQALLKLHQKRVAHQRDSRDGFLILRKEEPIETRVLRIICGALGVSRSHDVLQRNFFDLGGTSITSVSVVVRLRELGLDLTLDNFLKATTIGDVVNDILKAKTMAEVMTLFCSPSPAATCSSLSPPCAGRSGGRRSSWVEESSVVVRGGFVDEMDEEGEADDDMAVSDLGIPALHPDIPVCPSVGAVQQTRTKGGRIKGIRLAQLHTLPISQGVDKATVIDMVAESFSTRNPLDVAARVPRAAHTRLLSSLWSRLVHDDLSFVVKDPQRGILGVVINTDFFNEPQVEVPASMEVVAAIHEPLEEETRHQLRQEASEGGSRNSSRRESMTSRRDSCFSRRSSTTAWMDAIVPRRDSCGSGSSSRRESSAGRRDSSGGRRDSSTGRKDNSCGRRGSRERSGVGGGGLSPRWVHNLFLATNVNLSPQDNVRLVLHLEKELIRISQNRQYHGVFTVNSNPLNQLLCENYLGYERRGAVRPSSFLHHGLRPFASLPSDMLLVAMTKDL